MARPRSDRPRTKRLAFYVTFEEKGLIESWAGQAGITTAAFVRHCATSRGKTFYNFHQLSAELRLIRSELIRQGSNFNQLVRRINEQAARGAKFDVALELAENKKSEKMRAEAIEKTEDILAMIDKIAGKVYAAVSDTASR